MAIPVTLALAVWVIYNVVGVKSQGLFGYLKHSLFPPGVPKILYVIVTPIELVSTFVVRPFSLAIRLWANMVAGHLLLVTFAILSSTLWGFYYVPAALPFVMLILMTRLRDPGLVPSGVHLHHPHRGLHRRLHASRALRPTRASAPTISHTPFTRSPQRQEKAKC